MKNNLERILVIRPEELDAEFYFESLLEQAATKGILGESELERLQFECLGLMAHQTERYTMGDSSSVPLERAQGIMSSNLFTIGVGLKTYPTPDDAVAALQTLPISELYAKGRKRIDTLVSSTKSVHQMLVQQLVENDNAYYRSTAVDGIYGFFKLYDPDYGAQEIHITADYPTCSPLPPPMGIEFIKAYVGALYHENLFMSFFDPEDIHHLLCGYEQDYVELLINLYAPVLTTALGCVLAGAEADDLTLTEGDVAGLHTLFTSTPVSNIPALLATAAEKLCAHLELPTGLAQYVRACLPTIAADIAAALAQNRLGKLFPLPHFPENTPQLHFSFGQKMDDEEYRNVLEELRDCDLSEERLAIIAARIHSLADLEDLFLDAFLLDEEVHFLLSRLTLPEVTALYKRRLATAEMDEDELRDEEKHLHKLLQAFIVELPGAQQEIIERALPHIVED